MKSSNVEKIKSAFTAQAEHFETHKGNFTNKEYLDYVVSEVQPKKEDNVLEAAAGTCVCGRTFAPLVHSVTCVDLTPAMLSVGREQAEKQELKNMSFVIGDVNELPFLDNRFDIVISRLAFHHFADVNRAFSEMARVLKKGGIFVFIDMEATDEELRSVQDEIETMRDASHIKNLSKEEILKLFRDNHISIEKSSTVIMKKNLNDWLDFTNTPADMKKTIMGLFADDLSGKNKTGFYPYVEGSEVFFEHKWLMVIGKKEE